MVVNQHYEPIKKVWIPNDIKSSGEILEWIETAPNQEVIGWLSIGDGYKVFTITQSNRHLWKDIISEMRAHEAYLLLEQTKLVKRNSKER
tara:strand:- start:230 stop:499 length:270 start_codon:yes stop_codon:yes gene_type:complete